MTDANVGFSAFADGAAGHGWLGFAANVKSLFGLGNDSYTEFPWRYPVDMSYPAILNASGSGDVDPADSGNDSYNLNIEWATVNTPFADPIVDLPGVYKISLRSTSGSAQTADITPRKMQLFELIQGDTCSWTATDNSDDSLIASGTAEVDFDLLITIPGVPMLTDDGTLLEIDNCQNL